MFGPLLPSTSSMAHPESQCNLATTGKPLCEVALKVRPVPQLSRQLLVVGDNPGVAVLAEKATDALPTRLSWSRTTRVVVINVPVTSPWLIGQTQGTAATLTLFHEEVILLCDLES